MIDATKPQTLYITRWVLNTSCAKILKVHGYPVAGIQGAAAIVSGQLKRQIVTDDWFDDESKAKSAARTAIKESIRISERELARKQALLEALENDPEFISDQTSEEIQAAE